MDDGHVRGQCATLASEQEALVLQPEKKIRKLGQHEDKPPEDQEGKGGGAGGLCNSTTYNTTSNTSTSNSSNSCSRSNKKESNSSKSTSNKQRKKSCCSICLKEGHNKTKCMNKNDPTIIPPVTPVRALSYPPPHSKPTKYVYLDLEWTTDGEFEIIEIGCVTRIYLSCSSEEDGGGGSDQKAGPRWTSPGGEAFSNLIHTRRPKNDKKLGTDIHGISGKKGNA